MLGIAGEMPVTEAFPKARAAEQKALEIDDTLGEAHISLCMGMFWYDWDWQSAEKECLRGLEINPNNPDFHGHYATFLSNMGRHEEALAEAKRARELNPLNLRQNALEGQYLLHAGRTDEAMDRLRKLSELEPNFPARIFLLRARISKKECSPKLSPNHARNMNFPAETASRSAHMRWRNLANARRREQR